MHTNQKVAAIFQWYYSGGGGQPSAPSIQAISLSVVDTQNDNQDLLVGRGNGQFVLILRSATGVNAVPVNNTIYQVGDEIGVGNIVAYIGTQSELNISGLNADETQFYKAFEFNISGLLVSYNTSTPPSATERTFTNEYQAVLDYAYSKSFSPPVTLSGKKIDNELIREAKSIGLWAASPRFYNHHTIGDSNYALIDYKNPTDGTLAQLIDNPIYTEKGGFKGNGSSDGIDYNFALSTLGALITKEDFGVIAVSGGQNVQANTALFGVTGGGLGCYLFPRRNTNEARYTAGDNTVTNVANSVSTGVWDVRRKPNGDKELIKDGISLNITTISTENLSALEFHGLCRNNAGTLDSFHSGRLDMLIPYKQSLVAAADIKQMVDNHVNRVAAVVPELLSASVEEETADKLDLMFNISMNITSDGWSIETNGDPVTITGVSGSGTKSPSFSLSREIDPTETVSINYSESSGDTAALIGIPLEDIVGFFLELNFMLFGDLVSLFPTLDANKIRAKRSINWEKFKSQALASITEEEVMVLGPGRLELYFKKNDTIVINNGDVLHIQLDPSTEIITWPHYRDDGEYLFRVEYGGDLMLEGGVIRQHEPCKFEVYEVRLRNGGDSKKIAVLGSVRPEFWTDIKVGTRIAYNYGFETEAVFSTISSWDQENKTITIADDISDGIDDNLTGQYVVIGLKFKEDISDEDYNEYGYFWNWENDPDIVDRPQISLVRANPSGTAITQHLRLKNIRIGNYFHGLLLSCDKMELHLEGLVEMYGSEIAIAFFYNEGVIGENYIIQSGELHLFENGYIIRGGSATTNNLLGGGGYTAPNIQEHFNGVLRLTNNNALAWRQYSSQGTKPVNQEDESYFTEIIANGNLEMDILTSNSLPTTIHKISSGGMVRAGGNLSILEGSINVFGGNATQQPDANTPFEINILNCSVNGRQSFAYSSTRQENLSVRYQTCVFPTKTMAELSSIIIADDSELKSLELIDCIYQYNPASGVTEIGQPGSVLASSLIRLARFRKIILINLEVEAFRCTLFHTASFDQDVLDEFRIDSPNINCDRLTTLTNIQITSNLALADGINSEFSGNINVFQESGFIISAEGVETVDDSLADDVWAVEFDGVPEADVPVVGFGLLKSLI